MVNEEREPVKKSTKIVSPTHRKLEQLNIDQTQRIILEVGGTKFYTCERTLKATPNLLAKMLAKNSPMTPIDGVYVFDRDEKAFADFLYFLRTGTVLPHSPAELLALRVEGIFFECIKLVNVVERKLRCDAGLDEWELDGELR